MLAQLKRNSYIKIMCQSLYLLVVLIVFSSQTYGIRRVPSDSHHQSAPRRNLKEIDSSGPSQRAAPSLLSSTNKDHIQNIILQNRHLESDLLKSELPTPFDHIVTSLPFLDNDMFTTAHYAGHIPGTLKPPTLHMRHFSNHKCSFSLLCL